MHPRNQNGQNFNVRSRVKIENSKKGTSILLLGALKPLISNVTKSYAYPDNMFTPCNNLNWTPQQFAYHLIC